MFMNIDGYLKAFERWVKDNPYVGTTEKHRPATDFFPQPIAQEELQRLIRALEDSGSIKKHRYWYWGKYISYLINEACPEKEIELEVRYPFEHFGLYNTKTLIINGNLGNYAGARMQEGLLIIEGDVGTGLGDYMIGGKIEVRGNADGGAGSYMKGGEILIKGDAGPSLGMRMEGGYIKVEGNAKDYAGYGMRGGRIRIKGDAGDYPGSDMKGGVLIVEGNVGKEVGGDILWSDMGMKGGEIHIGGNYKSISEYVKGGCIYHKGILVNKRL